MDQIETAADEQSYERPTLRVLGSLEELTLGVAGITPDTATLGSPRVS